MATEETVAKAVRPYPPQHEGEPESNRVRERLGQLEPLCQRTYTPSLAVLQRSAGAYHWTAEGRRLADFTAGVLVANLVMVRWIFAPKVEASPEGSGAANGFAAGGA